MKTTLQHNWPFIINGLRVSSLWAIFCPLGLSMATNSIQQQQKYAPCLGWSYVVKHWVASCSEFLTAVYLLPLGTVFLSPLSNTYLQLPRSQLMLLCPHAPCWRARPHHFYDLVLDIENLIRGAPKLSPGWKIPVCSASPHRTCSSWEPSLWPSTELASVDTS